ncbi:MAG: adenylate/guanylate cyclase domain-containing protein [Pseudomonadota bacterium]
MQRIFDKISIADRDALFDPREITAVPDDRRSAAEDIKDWALQEGIVSPDVETLLDGFSSRLEALGMPISRVMVSIRVLAATVIARGYRWRPGQAVTQTTFDWEERDSGVYDNSPIKVVHETRDWFSIDVPNTPDSEFGIVSDLRAEGVAEYFVGPMFHSDGRINVINFSTQSPGGFSESDKAIIRAVTPTFAVAVELVSGRFATRDVLSIYVGGAAADQIVAGTVHRGEVTRINSAIMMVDMRDFTRMTMDMTAEDSAELLNRYYDCVVPPIEEQGGTVLKFVGDGILAIFPDDAHGPQEACCRALAASYEALARLPESCATGKRPFEIGIALHHGTAAYGNVGSGERLDFTVVGRDVNFTDRIGRLNKVLGEPLIASQPFSRTLGKPMRSLGRHVVPSFDEGIDAFVPEAC